jgi:hypothetical protein
MYIVYHMGNRCMCYPCMSCITLVSSGHLGIVKFTSRNSGIIWLAHSNQCSWLLWPLLTNHCTLSKNNSVRGNTSSRGPPWSAVHWSWAHLKKNCACSYLATPQTRFMRAVCSQSCDCNLRFLGRYCLHSGLVKTSNIPTHYDIFFWQEWSYNKSTFKIFVECVGKS